jgi:hypothetical protein
MARLFRYSGRVVATRDGNCSEEGFSISEESRRVLAVQSRLRASVADLGDEDDDSGVSARRHEHVCNTRVGNRAKVVACRESLATEVDGICPHPKQLTLVPLRIWP